MEKTLVIASAYDGHALWLSTLLRSLKKAGQDTFLIINKEQNKFLPSDFPAERLIVDDKDNRDHIVSMVYDIPFQKVITLQHDALSDKIMEGFPALKKKLPFFARIVSRFKTRPSGYGAVAAAMSQNGLTGDGQGISFDIPEREAIRAHDLPASHLAGYYCLVLDEQNTSGEYFSVLDSLLKDTDHPCVLLGNVRCKKPGDALVQANPIKVYNAIGKFSLMEMADIVRGCKLLVGADNDFLQLAIALQRKTVLLPGKKKREAPLGKLYGSKFVQSATGPVYSVVKNLKSAKTGLSHKVNEMLFAP